MIFQKVELPHLRELTISPHPPRPVQPIHKYVDEWHVARHNAPQYANGRRIGATEMMENSKIYVDLRWCAELSGYSMLKETEVASCNGEQPKWKNFSYKVVAKLEVWDINMFRGYGKLSIGNDLDYICLAFMEEHDQHDPLSSAKPISTCSAFPCVFLSESQGMCLWESLS